MFLALGVDDNGLMRRRDMSANDYPIQDSERRHHA
jgi:uncharacterized protein